MTGASAIRGRVFDVQRFSLHDGPGIRTVVFLKGCPLRCTWCANPESQRAEPEIAWFAVRCIGCGRCVEACPRGAVRAVGDSVVTDRLLCTACGACAAACARGARRLMGREMSVAEVMDQARRDAVFFRRSGGGVTFSGGEPFQQAAFLLECLRCSRRWGYHTALETCGQAHWEDLHAAAEFTDLFLYDVKHLDAARHRDLTGRGNELILGNLERLLELGATVTLRVPVVPGGTDDAGNLEALSGFVARHPRIRRVELLPYHRLGLHKYAALDMAGPAAEEPRLDLVEALAAQVAEAAGGVDCVVTRGLS